LRHIRIGHQSEEAVEVLAGLKDGEQVIRHPPSELADGTRASGQP
jgi:hypothetical protein